MDIDQVTHIYQFLLHHGATTWLQGGWGIDALLGRQTREHKDVDLLVEVKDVTKLLHLLEPRGFTLAYTWEENVWVVDKGIRTPTAFVLSHADGRELDVHAARLDTQGQAIPAWDSELVFTPEDLSGTGTLKGVPVRCWSAKMQMRTHLGYELPRYQIEDLKLLHEVLGVDYPESLLWLDSDA